MWCIIARLIQNCSTNAGNISVPSCKAVYKIAVEFTFIKCEFVWTYRTNCGVFLISFYA